MTDPDPSSAPSSAPFSARSWDSQRESISDDVANPKIAEEEPVEVLDCRGQRCPLPVIALARRLPALPVGAVLRVLADDPAAANDIPAWCRLRGQEYVGSGGEHAFDIRRRQ